jgi:hypothetical protein
MRLGFVNAAGKRRHDQQASAHRARYILTGVALLVLIVLLAVELARSAHASDQRLNQRPFYGWRSAFAWQTPGETAGAFCLARP